MSRSESNRPALSLGLTIVVAAVASCSGGASDAAPAANSGSDAAATSQTASPEVARTPASSAAAGNAGSTGSAAVPSPGTAAAAAASAGSSATAASPGAASAANSGGNPGSNAAGGGGSQAGAGAAAGANASTGASANPPAAGTTGAATASAGTAALPPISDPGAKGPFEIQVQESLEGLDTHISIAPKELGKDGIKHPIVVWINGAGTGTTGYRNMLDNVAAHGFFLLDDKQSGFESQPEVDSQRAAITWAIEQAGKQGGPYFGKLDPTRIAIAGHSLGGVSSFGNVSDMRIKTSIHMAGGVTGNPEGVDASWLQGLHVPAAFLCGDRDSNGLPRVKDDFAAAPAQVPLFFGILAGVSHTDEFTMPNGGRWGRILVAWLRWQLADDASFAKSFQGPDCEFCKGDWTAMKHAID